MAKISRSAQPSRAATQGDANPLVPDDAKPGRWSISTRTTGEVLTTDIRGDGLRVMLFSKPSDQTAFGIEGHVSTMFESASAEAARDQTGRAVPALLHHLVLALVDLVEEFERTTGRSAGAVAFYSSTREVAFAHVRGSEPDAWSHGETFAAPWHAVASDKPESQSDTPAYAFSLLVTPDLDMRLQWSCLLGSAWPEGVVVDASWKVRGGLNVSVRSLAGDMLIDGEAPEAPAADEPRGSYFAGWFDDLLPHEGRAASPPAMPKPSAPKPAPPRAVAPPPVAAQPAPARPVPPPPAPAAPLDITRRTPEPEPQIESNDQPDWSLPEWMSTAQEAPPRAAAAPADVESEPFEYEHPPEPFEAGLPRRAERAPVEAPVESEDLEEIHSVEFDESAVDETVTASAEVPTYDDRALEAPAEPETWAEEPADDRPPSAKYAPYLEEPQPVAHHVDAIEDAAEYEYEQAAEIDEEPAIASAPSEGVITEPILGASNVAAISSPSAGYGERMSAESDVEPDFEGALTVTEASPRSVRRPSWPHIKRRQHGFEFDVRRHGKWGALLVVLFAMGWWVGTRPHADAGPAGKLSPAMRALRAVGIGGAHYTVRVTSDPAGANISVDGTPTGKQTPFDVEVAVGPRSIELSFPESGVSAYKVDGKRGEQVRLDASLTSTLQVVPADPSVPVEVRLDGEPRGFAPVRIAGLTPGPHQVVFSAPGQPLVSQTVRVPVRGDIEIVARSFDVPETGMMQIRSTYTDEDGTNELKGAAVWIDGERRGSTPLEVELTRGPHSVRAEYNQEAGPVQVLDLPGGNTRYAAFNFGGDAMPPSLVLRSPLGPMSLTTPTQVTVSVRGLGRNDLREVWLHVRSEDGLWRRYAMNIVSNPGNLMATLVFPNSTLDASGVAPFYVSALVSTGEEYFTEIQNPVRRSRARSDAGTDGTEVRKPAPRPAKPRVTPPAAAKPATPKTDPVTPPVSSAPLPPPPSSSLGAEPSTPSAGPTSPAPANPGPANPSPSYPPSSGTPPSSANPAPTNPTPSPGPVTPTTP